MHVLDRLRRDTRALHGRLDYVGGLIGLLEQLRPHVGGDAARWLHWGATTQDILDNAMMVQLAGALGAIPLNNRKLIRPMGHFALTRASAFRQKAQFFSPSPS
jgi:hypothetical protein